MSFAAVAAAAIGAGTTIYMGAKQRKAAKRARQSAVDPGIQPNYALDRVTNTLFQNYSNYNLPGYSKMMDQIGSAQASANQAAVNASTSSSDIINAITNNQAISDNASTNLAVTQASGKEQALMNYLRALESSGQDQVRMNQAQLSRYDASLREAAALEGAGLQNQYQGFNDALTAAGAIAGNFMPRTSIDPNTGESIKLPSVWKQLYGKK